MMREPTARDISDCYAGRKKAENERKKIPSRAKQIMAEVIDELLRFW